MCAIRTSVFEEVVGKKSTHHLVEDHSLSYDCVFILICVYMHMHMKQSLQGQSEYICKFCELKKYLKPFTLSENHYKHLTKRSRLYMR